MKNHQDIEFMKLIAAAAAWPPNRNFLYYFIYLWSRHNTIRTEIRFENQSDASILNSLITSIPQEDASFLSTICDCSYADQRLDIPVGWKNNPFRFFFGDLERPLAFMERFIADFVPLDDIFRERIGFTPSSLLDFSLTHQDFLIDKLAAITSAVDTNPGNSIVAPPHEFIEGWWQYLHDSWSRAFAGLSPDYRTEVQVWLDKKPASYETAGQSRQDYDSLMKLFPIIPNNDSFLVPFPQMWLGYLINIFVEEVRHLWPTEPRIETRLSDQARIRMYRALAELTYQTPDAPLVTGVYLRNGKTSSEEIDALLIVDNDKLVVLKSVAGIDSQNFEPLISKACSALSSIYNLIDKASTSQKIEIVKANGEQIWPLKGANRFRVYPVIVVNQLTLDAISASLEGSPNDTQALMLTDLEALSAEIQDTLEFVRFLQAIVEIQNSGVKLIQTDFLDLWAWYRDSGHNFLWSAKGHPNAVFIDPHWYSGKEMDSLAGKSTIRRLMITQRIPERCQFLNIDENTAKLMDPISLIGVTVRTSKLAPQVVMVHICSRESEGKDVQINESLAESLLRRYEEIRDAAGELISLAPVEAQERLIIWLYGERTLSSSRVLRHLREYLGKNKREPVLSKGTLLRDGAVGIAILYRDSLLELMGAGTIEGEICLINALLVGIGMSVNAPPELVK
ncbi:MAG: hypothetical protein PHU23_13945, partial [Dehalococcoidales bacterium]|nr:hypothetical protein [Dehalococcoidales bacterium]